MGHDIEAVFFDLDGVLVDAANLHRESFDSAIHSFVCDKLTDEEHENDFNGLSTKRKLEMLVSMGRLKDSPTLMDAIGKLKQFETHRLIGLKCQRNERIIELVRHARATVGTVAVVTNCSRATACEMLRLTGISGAFDLLITNEDVDGKIKPNPWPYLKARFHFGIKYKNALAIDDTDRGMISAVDAGCRTWKLERFEDLTVGNFERVLSKLHITI